MPYESRRGLFGGKEREDNRDEMCETGSLFVTSSKPKKGQERWHTLVIPAEARGLLPVQSVPVI